MDRAREHVSAWELLKGRAQRAARCVSGQGCCLWRRAWREVRCGYNSGERGAGAGESSGDETAEKCSASGANLEAESWHLVTG